MIRAVTEEVNYYKKEVHILRSEKDTLENVLVTKSQDVRKTITNDVTRVEEDLKRNFQQQKSENTRVQQQITSIKGEKTNLQQQLLGIFTSNT
jgi:hypothetical protein